MPRNNSEKLAPISDELRRYLAIEALGPNGSTRHHPKLWGRVMDEYHRLDIRKRVNWRQRIQAENKALVTPTGLFGDASQS